MLGKILKKGKEKQGAELIKEAQDLGVETIDLMQRREPDYSGLQERVRSAKKTRYTRLAWIIGLITVIVLVISIIV